MATLRGWDDDELNRRAEELLRFVREAWQAVLAAVERFLAGNETFVPEDFQFIRQEWDQQIREILIPRIEVVYADSSARVVEALDLPEDLLGTEPLNAYIRERENLLSGRGDEIWQAVRTEILDGISEGESIPEIADRVREAASVDDATADVIARTEVHAAHEAGTHAQAMAFGQGTKEWLATNDTRTRPTHREADGQRVPLGEPFQVGATNLRYPGDVLGAADEVINCRCTTLYDFEEDSVTASTTSRDSRGRFMAKSSGMAKGRTTVAEEKLRTRQQVTASKAAYGRELADGVVVAESVERGQRFRWDATAGRFALESRKVDGSWDVSETLTRKEAYEHIKSGVWYMPDEQTVTAAAHGMFAPGDRVVVVGEPHEPGQTAGVITEGGGTAYAVLFDGSEEPHKWYVAEELAPEEVTEMSEEWDGNLGFDDNDEPMVPNVLIPLEALQEIDVNVPGAPGHALRNYWVRGPGAARIRWGTEGSMSRCIRFLSEYVRDPGGLCAEYHRAATGEWPRGGAIPSEGETVALQVAEEDCPEGEHRMPDGECMPDEEMEAPRWRGVLTVEGMESGDGRMFGLNALTWDDPPLPLMWQKVTSHGGKSDVSVRVGSIDRIWREPGPLGDAQTAYIMGEGTIDTGSDDGREVYRRMRRGYMRGNSVDVDSVNKSNVTLIYGDGEEGMPLEPEIIRFDKGRIRATTLVEIPAFTEARVFLVDEEEEEVMTASAAFGAVGVHDTPTVDEPWDGDEAVRRLDSPLTVETVRNVFAYFDSEEVEDGQMPKSAGKLPHHEVSEDGTPGAANVRACSAGIGALHGARGGVDIPEADRRAVYDHLAAHLRDADMEPPPFSADVDADLVAATIHVDTPPREWFDEPTDVQPTGALTVTSEGRIYGYVAPAGVRHRSFSKKAQYVPMKKVDYSRFLGGQTITADGSRVSTGNITMNCGHATTAVNLTASKAAEHYDNTCSVVATVRVGENQHGVWLAGALLPDVTPDQVRRIMACRISGDWRTHLDKPGWREFVAALLVPVPGFPMSRSMSVELEDGELVASSAPVRFESTAARPKRDYSDRVAAMRDKVTANTNRVRAMELSRKLRENGI